MVRIIQDFIPQGRRNRPGYAMVPSYLTTHSTANTQNGADAKAHSNYVKNTPNLEASWHFTVDDGVIYQHLPLNENGWHAGDGANGTGNRQSIGIEICENRDGDQAVAIRNAAWLTAKLMQEHGIPIGNVVQHNRWNGKNCPGILRSGNGWNNFLDQIRGFYSSGSDLSAAYYIVKPNDTLGEIAKKYNTTVAVLAAINNISNPNLIFPGNKIYLPEGGNSSDLQSRIAALEKERDSLVSENKKLKSAIADARSKISQADSALKI